MIGLVPSKPLEALARVLADVPPQVFVFDANVSMFDDPRNR
jgi:hypothetical protein